MLVSPRLERLLRRVHGARWNAVARAEYRLGGGRRTLPGALGPAALAYVLIAGLGLSQGLEAFFGVTLMVVCGAGLWVLGAPTGSMNRLFLLARDQGVLDAWIMLPMPREELLRLRLAGRVGARPLLVLALFPLHLVTAAALPVRWAPLFVCGHVARIGAFVVAADGGLEPTLASVLAAAPVAALAVVADCVLLEASGAAILLRALQQFAGRRLFRDFDRWRAEWPPLFLAGSGMALLFLLLEGAVAGASALASFACVGLPGPVEVVFWVGFAAGAGALLVLLRRWLARLTLALAARSFDDVLIRD